MLSYFENYPDKRSELESKYGTIDISVSSEDIDLDNGRKLLIFPMLTDGKVTAIIGGVINAERDYLYFDVYKKGHPDHDYLINTFQIYYNIKTISRNGSNNPINVGDVIIVVKKPQLTKLDPFDNEGGDGHDMEGGNGDYGDGSGSPSGSTPPATTNNPCEKSKPAVTAANKVLKNSKVQQNMDAVLKGKTQASNEWVVAIGQNTNGTYEVTPAQEAGTSQGSVPNSQLSSTYIGDGHSHAGGYGTPSAGDFYGMLKMMLTNTNLKYRFVYGDYFGTPETYVLIVSDRNLGADFLANYPESQNYDSTSHSFLEGSPVGVGFFDIKEMYGQGTYTSSIGDINGSTAGLAYILEKFNTGISLGKVDDSGEIKKVNVTKESIIISGGGGVPKQGVKVIDCPSLTLRINKYILYEIYFKHSIYYIFYNDVSIL